MSNDLHEKLDELSTAPRFERKSRVIDGLLYLEMDRSLRRRICGEDGPIEYRETPE